MTPEVWVSILGALGIGGLVHAIAKVVQGFDLRQWLADRKDAAAQASQMTRSQLEQEQGRRHEDAERHRIAMSELRDELEVRIDRLTSDLAEATRRLSDCAIHNARLALERDQLQRELAASREAYNALLPLIALSLAKPPQDPQE